MSQEKRAPEKRRVSHHRADWLAPVMLVLLALVARLPELLHWVSADLMSAWSLYRVDKSAMLPGHPTIDPCAVAISLALGHRAALDWLAGSIPWWNPYEGIGAPLAGEMQCAGLFLPFILLLSLKNGQLYFHMALQAVTGLCTYYLLRQIGMSRTVGLAGGALLELNGTFVWLRNAPCQPIPFLPMLLLGVEQAWATAKNDKAGGWVLIALALAWSLYAGFPETAYIDGLLALAWTITRFCQSLPSERLLFAKKVLTGGLTGLMLAAPILTAFFDYLNGATVGAHEMGVFAHAGYKLTYIPQLLMPYIYGPIASFEISPPALWTQWGAVGGYLGASPLFFCLFSLVGKTNRALRFVLFGWIVVALSKSFDTRPVSDIVNLLPFIKEAAFYRYCLPSVNLAVSVLTAFALADLRSLACNRAQALAVGAVSIGLISFGPFIFSGNWLDGLSSGQNAANWLSGSMFWGGLTYTIKDANSAAIWIVGSMVLGLSTALAATALAIFMTDRKLKTALISAVLVSEALLLFFIPCFSNPQRAHAEFGGIRFLQQHQEMSRFYTLGPIEPNIGSYFGLASINYNDIPLPRLWTAYRNSKLYHGDPMLFLGVSGDPDIGKSPTAQLCRNLKNYEWVGVKYVVTPPDSNPFISLVNTVKHPSDDAHCKPVFLSREQKIQGLLPDRLIKEGLVSGVSVKVGNCYNNSDGRLTVNLACGDAKATGAREIRESSDNQYFTIDLDHPLVVPKQHHSISYQFDQEHSAYPLAIYVSPTDSGGDSVRGSQSSPGDCCMALIYENYGADKGKIVYHDKVMDIYELPHPGPYFEVVQGSAVLQSLSRTELTVDSRTGCRLLRRELYFPGWSATVNGAQAPIEPYGGIFQSVTLPVGRSKVQFTYLPPGMGAASVAFAIACLILLSGCLRLCNFRRRGPRGSKEADAEDS